MKVASAGAGLFGASAVPAERDQAVAPGAVLGQCTVLAGSSSWADRSLVRDSGFYPARTMSASQRLAHYASRLPLAEVATTYRFPPTPEMTARWADITPPGFAIDVRAWSLLCGAPTWPESLWADLQGHVKPSRREGSKLYRQHLPTAVVDECWDRFDHALRPLVGTGRLGAVIVRFPSWFSPRPAAVAELAALTTRLPGLRIAVELTNDRWFAGPTCEETLGTLESLGLCFVCRDTAGPGRPVVAATADLALVRFPGRPPSPPMAGGQAWASAHTYRYSRLELAEWATRVRDLAAGTSQLHLLFDNCWRDNAVENAATMLSLLCA